MKVLGIESSCDECSASVVEDGRTVLSLVIASQVPVHQRFQGVVPEVASRMHLEWIRSVCNDALSRAGLDFAHVDAVAATRQPGLSGSLVVGHTFAKTLAWAGGKPFIGVDHMLAHLYAPQLEKPVDYPFLGLLVSGGHSLIVRVDAFDRIEVLGASIDDAVGEAFDKVARHYGLGYPGGKVIDDLARNGDPDAFRFPLPNLYKGHHPYDVSYSGLKNAAVNQLDLFWNGTSPRSIENIAASFERTAIDILVRKLLKASHDLGLCRIVAGGGVAANSRLRRELATVPGLEVHFPALELCGDNAAMVAGLGWHYLQRGERSPWHETVQARVQGFRKTYPQGKKA